MQFVSDEYGMCKHGETVSYKTIFPRGLIWSQPQVSMDITLSGAVSSALREKRIRRDRGDALLFPEIETQEIKTEEEERGRGRKLVRGIET